MLFDVFGFEEEEVVVGLDRWMVGVEGVGVLFGVCIFGWGCDLE